MAAAMPSDTEVDDRAMRIFKQAIDELGGPVAMLNHGEQRILPTLLESAYIVVLREEAAKNPEEIAQQLGIAPGAVYSVFDAPMEEFTARIRYRADPHEEYDRHIDPERSGEPMTNRLEPEYLVGALAKFAYDMVRRKERGKRH